MTDPIRATVVEEVTAHRDVPGAIMYERDAPGGTIVRMYFVCPCGCRKIGMLRFGGTGWKWNCDPDAPAVAPSVMFEQGQEGTWHGYLGAADGSQPGFWVSC